ncbi:unnamed protein product [Bursaphelenchus xylophilus]|uniref:(pine wood nematode) hypothetical protein n=1 Tax=Bursaphelenchus xylophilus TaxID=6326 RepID=A0A811L111_BURXY|nr:unnamed protein product [Bursaphelenchus xylophilus]CAG9111094.1 unnamed protein product [Bursaphelenchus xylophilus]
MDRKLKTRTASERNTSQFPDILKRFRSLRNTDKVCLPKEEKENEDPTKPDCRPGGSKRKIDFKPRSKSCLKPVTRFVTKLSKRYNDNDALWGPFYRVFGCSISRNAVEALSKKLLYNKTWL